MGLVDRINARDVAGLAAITCDPLKEQVSQIAGDGSDRVVYDHVANIKVSPEGRSGTVDVFAYQGTEKPPGTPVTFVLQKQGAAWKACDANG